MRAADAAVQVLREFGVRFAFTVPGESFLGILDALVDEPQIEVVAARHEGGAAFMAEAVGKLTGVPALCMGTRAVGTALLAGAGVLSVVAGLAAQDTLANLIAGFSLVMSGAIREGDTIKLYTPVGLITARVQVISLGFTVLLDDDANQVVVPNSVIMTSAILRVSEWSHTRVREKADDVRAASRRAAEQ